MALASSEFTTPLAINQKLSCYHTHATKMESIDANKYVEKNSNNMFRICSACIQTMHKQIVFPLLPPSLPFKQHSIVLIYFSSHQSLSLVSSPTTIRAKTLLIETPSISPIPFTLNCTVDPTTLASGPSSTIAAFSSFAWT